ncbi:MAG TPA: hypothetical protein VFX70_17470 [Mycobacteriales bacterium]|nr:hypothetical protein [Mycobacteriales bacterium]
MTTVDTDARLAEIRADYHSNSTARKRWDPVCQDVGFLLGWIDNLTAALDQAHTEAAVDLAEIAAERDRLAGLLDHATRFTFSDLPVGHPLRPAWAVDAVLCGSGTWEVRRGSWRLSRDGKWTTADGFSVEHQFDLDTALVVAKQAAHEMTIGTYTAAEASGLLCANCIRDTEEPGDG